MKKIILLFVFTICISSNAQEFKKNWEKVYQFEYDGKIKSASKEVDKIYKKAQKNNAQFEIVKTFIYQSKYLQTLEEDAQFKIISNLQKEISTENAISKSLFNYIYSKLLWQYQLTKQYNPSKKTQTDTVYNPDFRTWSYADFTKKINQAFEESIKNEEILLKTPLKNHEDLFIYTNDDIDLNLCLYDFLTSTIIDNYSGGEYKFVKKNLHFLYADTEDFQKLNLDTIAGTSLHKKLTIYKKLEHSYSSTNNDLALAHTVLRRLKSIKSFSEHRREYLLAVKKFASKFQNKYKLAFEMETAILYNEVAREEPDSSFNVKSLRLVENIIASNQEPFLKTAKNLKLTILQKNVSIETQKNVLPDQLNRALVSFKNVNTIYSKFYKISNEFTFENDPDEFSYSKKRVNLDSIYIDFANKNKPYKIFENVLPDKNDYLEHTTEIIIPALEKGNYLMISTTVKDSLTLESPYAYTFINASEIIVSHSQLQDATHFQVLHRKTGKPIENAIVNVDEMHFKTNKNGYAIINKLLSETTEMVKIVYEKDTILERFYNHNNREDSKEQKFIAKVTLFTDRSIYRPGQSVFFKGILVQRNEEKNSVVPNTYVKIIVQNTNREEIYNTRLKTNEFGSISGEFVIPKNSLTGNFSIMALRDPDYKTDDQYNLDTKTHPFWDELYDFQRSTSYFSVEEYKRPKFEIIFEPVKENFIIGQKIKIRGKAKAFAGANISDAKVTYSISKKSYYDNYRNHDSSDEDENSTAENLTTDQNGNFEIEFTAQDTQINKNDTKRILHYTIDVEITDINGETRESSSTIKIGNHTLVLDAQIEPIFDNLAKQTITLQSKNLNDQFTPVTGEIKIFKRIAPSRVLGDRLWNTPEIQTISEKDFIELFPNEPYTNENEISKWAKGKLVFSRTVNTEKEKKIILENFDNWESGLYELYFTAKDDFGNQIEASNIFTLVNKNDKTAPDKRLFYIETLNKNPKKDGFIDLRLSSATPLLYINTEVFNENNLVFNKIIELKNNVTVIRIPIHKNWKEVNVDINFIWENQNFKTDLKVPLPEIKENLFFETITLRNKIEPGNNEKWSFLIQNNDKKSVKAETLATMYDSSLDQFSQSDWSSNLEFFSERERSNNEKRVLGLENSTRYFKNFKHKYFGFSSHQFKNDLNWFGFDFINPEKNNSNYRKFLTEKVVQSSGKLITGIVSDRSGPLPGAIVRVSGTTRAVETDFDGNYKIKALFGEILEFHFIGYQESFIRISDNVVDVTMEEGILIGEVIVESAMGIQKKSSALASSYQITTENSESLVYANVSEMLVGRVAGLQINTDKNENTGIFIRGKKSTNNEKALIIIDGKMASFETFSNIPTSEVMNMNVLNAVQGSALYGSQGANGVIVITTKASVEDLSQIKTRKNFNETAFFFPQIKTDKDGKISFNFTSPEALTQWKLRLFAHDKKANSGYFEHKIITQKDFMITPNLPRFLREKDSITITTKISNLTAEAKSGMAMLQLFDAVSMEAVDAKMLNLENTKPFKINAKGNTSVSWKIYVPEGLQGVQYKIVAKAGNFSDGEENILPVLTNNMLVTESISVWVRENSSKEYTFENLKNNTSTTLRNQQLTFEYTSNPTWLAIQALPYLMEYEHECAEQTFARYYANALASEILNSNPKIAEVFESWKKSERPISKLEQNEELKSVLLAETPWISDALSEEEKKKNLATLFDLQKMKDSQVSILEKLTKKQKASGGFSWFDDGNESEYITRHIISGLGHLQKLSKNTTGDFDEITKKGIGYLDQKFMENHTISEANNKTQKLIWMYPYNNLHYLYARSFYLEKYPLTEITSPITQKYTANIKENWLNYSLYEKGLASLVLSRFGEKETAKKILESLRQTSSNNEDWGMYWIENKSGWYWYQAPIETQALLIEAFAEIENDKKSVDAMKVWLLKNKQNRNWPTTKATTEAIYALVMQGNDWISVKDKTVIKLGDEKIVTKKLSENEKEAGTGYIKMNWKSDEITKEMATVSINNKSVVPGFGGFYWQYFEDLDKIKSSQESPMTIDKELYLKATTSEGNQLQRITNVKPLKIGDLVTVRLVISTKEDMEYVHLKDMRASCFEPIDVLSKYKWQDGLGFYQSTKDVATHFFFDKIKKGKFVVEYDIRVNNLGDFSNGITTIQSMYAPEFSSHTKGIRVKIEE